MTENTTVIGLEEFTGDLKKLSAAARHATIMDALEAGARVIQAYAQENVRNKLNKHPLGFLTNSIGVKREGNSVLVGAFGVIYAKIHEFGGVIVPRHAKALRFKVDGQWIITKKVTIPARPYLRPALDHMDEIKQAIIDALRGLLQAAIR
jgi:HK97 gp10 family phage protein